jgi:hypothetical protein
MEFLLYERKFKLIGEDLFSFYKRGNTKTEKWYKIKLKIDNGYNRFAFHVEGKKKNFQFHRVVYYAHNNQWDLFDNSKENVIDHIDNVKTNNHISNLRNVSQQENSFNTRCKGYTFRKESNKYEAQIQLNGKLTYIGRYDTEEDAHEAYLNKKEKYHKIRAR